MYKIALPELLTIIGFFGVATSISASVFYWNGVRFGLVTLVVLEPMALIISAAVLWAARQDYAYREKLDHAK